jgi:tetratricopeptide (TPR) repeat protein
MGTFRFSTTWSKAMQAENFGIIADWFIFYFFWVGFLALLVVGFAATYPDMPAPAAAAVTNAATSATNPAVPAPPAPAALPHRPDRTFVAKPSAGGWGEGIRVFALGLLLAGACTGIGWLFGLLFGVPRSLAAVGPQASTPTATAAVSSAGAPATAATASSGSARPVSRVNTNLEDVSDWLTKTLVGVGLTQLTSLPKFLGDLALDINDYGFAWGNYGQLLALAVILYFVPGGFWLGYVGTRTFLTRLFDKYGSGVPAEIVSTSASADNLTNTDAGIMPASDGLKASDEQILREPPEHFKTSLEVMAWAGAQARAQNLTAARIALEDALRLDPANADLKEQLGKIDLALGRYRDAAELLQNAADSPTTLLSALYEPHPTGYEKAIAIGERLVATNKYKSDPSVHGWLACAYAQKFGDSRRHGADAAELKALRDKAVAEIRTAIGIDPKMSETLRAFWKPSPGSIDDDLTVFDGDPEVEALLAPAGAAPPKTETADKPPPESTVTPLPERPAPEATPLPGKPEPPK